MKYIIITFLCVNSFTVLALGINSKTSLKEKEKALVIKNLAQSYKAKSQAVCSKNYCKLEGR